MVDRSIDKIRTDKRSCKQGTRKESYDFHQQGHCLDLITAMQKAIDQFDQQSEESTDPKTLAMAQLIHFGT